MTQKKQVLDYVRRTTLNTVYTVSPPANCDYLEIQVLTQDCYVTIDGDTPSATKGFLLKKDGIFAHELHPNNTIKIIEAAASAEVRIYFYKINEGI